jgi:hypothetical protein
VVSIVFGLALCSQFDATSRSAPLLVERCTQALEERAATDATLDLYKVYHSSPPNEQTLELRQGLNEGESDLLNFNGNALGLGKGKLSALRPFSIIET